MKNLIITHLAPAHIDDWVGVALMRHANPEAEVLRVSPQAVPAADESAIMVDVGREYDPTRGRFDHHQDVALPCAAVLVAEAMELQGFIESPAAKFMSIKDGRGFAAAVEATGYRPPRELAALEGRLLSTVPELDGERGVEIGHAVYKLLAGFRGKETYEDLIRGLWQSLPEAVRQAALDREAAYQRELEAVLDAAKVEEVNDFNVVRLDRPWGRAGEIFAGMKARGIVPHVVISPNHMGKGTSVVKNTAEKKSATLDLGKVAEALGVEQIFLHATGFIAVLDVEPDQIDTRRLIEGAQS